LSTRMPTALRSVSVLVLLGLAACGGNGGSKNSEEPIVGEPTKVVATVDGKEITLAEVDQVLRAWKSGRFPDVDLTASQGVLQRKALDNLVDQRLLYRAAQAAGTEPAQEEVEAQIQQIRARFPSKEVYEQTLAQEGYNEADMIEAYRTDRAVRMFVQKAYLDTVQVSPEQARRHFETHPDEFVRPGRIRARHILLRVAQGASPEEDAAVRAKMDALARRVAAGEDFVSLAIAASEDGSAANGGDLGFFARGQMVAPFEDAAFALALGEVSAPVRSAFGYHLIRLEERQPAGAFQFEEVAEPLFQKLRQERTDEHLQAFLAEQRKKVKVKRMV